MRMMTFRLYITTGKSQKNNNELDGGPKNETKANMASNMHLGGIPTF
jgi:hypothetical protein